MSVAIGLMIFAFIVFLALIWLVSVEHKWKYRNPFDRTCKTCGRHEVKFGFKMTDRGWWEVMSPGKTWEHDHWADKPLLRRLFRLEIIHHNISSSIKRSQVK